MGLSRTRVAAALAAALILGGCTGMQPEQEGTETEQQGETPAIEAEELPRRYDAREHGRTSPVKNQGDLGACWAFASLLALESRLLPEEHFDFSEDHMIHNPNFILGQDGGGDYTMSMAYLLSWQGPVLEEQDPYGDGVSPEGLSAVRHVQEIRILPEHDREAIKQAVYSGGGVQSALYTSLTDCGSSSPYYNPKTGAYCYPEESAPNHDVVIVGWDDDYPRENFSVEVPGDGAFLCENSWGTQFGQNGYFHVSYYDGTLGKVNLHYSSVESADHYDRIYQSDLCGWVGQVGYGEESAWAVNVFEAVNSGEILEAVGFYATMENTSYEIYAVTGIPGDPVQEGYGCFSERQQNTAGTLNYAGYYTIPLKEPVKLQAGERFGVMVRLTTPGAVHPIAVEYDAEDGKCRIDLSDGEGYISSDGIRWERTEKTQGCNLCLKAYTSLH